MSDYSVLMSVYYKESSEYFKQSLESIANQTVLPKDFVLVCDGKLTEELYSVIDEYKDTELFNLKVIQLKKNLGLGCALNEGIKHCDCEIIARMDSDDISIENRCEKQLSVFENIKDLSFISGTVEEFTDDGMVVGYRILPESNEEIRKYSIKRNPFNHPAIMFKKTSVLKAGGYRQDYPLFEDYDLWIRMLMNDNKGYNIPEPILKMRISDNLYNRRGGLKYAKDMMRFHCWLCKEKWSNPFVYISVVVPHAIVCVLPVFIRRLVYKSLHK